MCHLRERVYVGGDVDLRLLLLPKDQRRGGLLDLFRIELCQARDQAKAMGRRPRIISGGGDGTASFTIFMIFAALRADDTRADEGLRDSGNGFIWSDEDPRDCCVVARS